MHLAFYISLLAGVTIIWLLPLYVGHQVGKPKGRAGFLWAFFLGWIGVLIVAVLPPTRFAPGDATAHLYRDCPHCKEPMRRDASVCPHCRSESRPWRLHDGAWFSQSDEDAPWYWLDEETNTWERAVADDEGAKGSGR